MSVAVRILGRSAIRSVAGRADYLAAVAAGFAQLADGSAAAPPPLHVAATAGGFHAKAASFDDGRAVVALKFNGNFPGNLARGLPTIQGAILLADAADGTLLAVLDSQEITLRRTGAATALAVRCLAHRDSCTVAICGCGAQARAQLEAIADVIPLRQAHAWDIDTERAHAFAREMSAALGIPVRAAARLADATPASDVVVTCTTAKSPFLGSEHLRAGAFVAAVGADSPAKSELEPDLLAGATVVCDTITQCAAMGDLHHALAAGAMSESDVHAELGEIVTRRKPGRRSDDEIIVFDSTGVAVQDAACAARVFERAVQAGVGLSVMLAD